MLGKCPQWHFLKANSALSCKHKHRPLSGDGTLRHLRVQGGDALSFGAAHPPIIWNLEEKDDKLARRDSHWNTLIECFVHPSPQFKHVQPSLLQLRAVPPTDMIVNPRKSQELVSPAEAGPAASSPRWAVPSWIPVGDSRTAFSSHPPMHLVPLTDCSRSYCDAKGKTILFLQQSMTSLNDVCQQKNGIKRFFFAVKMFQVHTYKGIKN